jgi:dTDP-glucose 4,6-dehydratase
MKILLTGGAGFIGSHFVKKAIQCGHDIVNVDKLTYAGNLDNLEQYRNEPQHHFYKVDICNRQALAEVFKKEYPDVVVHMAAESHVDRSIDSGDVFVQTNVVGTFNLLQTSLEYFNTLADNEKKAFRFLHLSTDEVFGTLTPKEDKFCETTPYCPSSPYSAAKASSDLFVKAFHHTYGLPTVVVNTTNNYGPFQYPEKLIPVVTLNALSQKPIPIYGDGKQIRDWLFVEDHVEALLGLLTQGQIGASYCVGGENEWTNLDIVTKICEILDAIRPLSGKSYKDFITFVQDRPGHDRRYAINASKIRKSIGWSAKHSMEDGLAKTVNWYVDNFERLDSLFDRHRLGLKGK